MRSLMMFLLSIGLANTSLAQVETDRGLFPNQRQSDLNAPAKGLTVDQVVTRHLFKQYVNNPARIQTREVNAAIELVGVRGVDDPAFMRSVLAAYKVSIGPQPKSMRGPRWSLVKRNLLQVFARYFQMGGGIRRWRKESGHSFQVVFNALSKEQQKLESTILKTLIERAGQSELPELRLIVIAVRNAHHIDSRKFLTDVLKKNMGEAGFRAAVGLAELGNSSGVEWLLKNAQLRKTGSQYQINDGHFSAEKNDLNTNCRYSLVDLFGLESDTQVAELKSWWNQNKTKFQPSQEVNLIR